MVYGIARKKIYIKPPGPAFLFHRKTAQDKSKIVNGESDEFQIYE